MDQVLLNNRYRILQRIGVGGMAYVYEAEDILLKRKVAVKVLKNQYIEDEEFVRKFENEALAAASLSHPNIVNIYDVGSEEIQGQKYHYIVMELIEGSTLKDAIAAQGQMDSTVVARIGSQIAMALQCAHDHNLVHRDIKPANILIMKSGDIKVADFGIARISSASTVTYTNSILGTVHYISPEQAKGRFTDFKSDIYSLGVVMYEMATGQVPFDADNSVGIAIKHIQESPVPPIDLNPDLSPALNRIILTCMEKNPEDRYASASDLVGDLKNFRSLSNRDTVYMKTPPPMPNYRSEDHKLARKKHREVVYESNPSHPVEEEEKKSGFPWFALVLVAVAIATVLLVTTILGGQNANRLEASQTRVPSVINLSVDEAMDLLKNNDLLGEVVERTYDDKTDEGLVMEQSIKSGTTVDKGTKVELKVSQGKNTLPIPDVTGSSQEDAASTLTNAGFTMGQNIFENSDEVEKGHIIRTEPRANERLEQGGRVNLVVSDGPEEKTSKVPVLIGADQNKANQLLQEAELKLGSIEPRESSYPSGIVIEQSIKAGEEVPTSTTINLVISSGPKANLKPNLVDFTLRIYPPEGKETFSVEVFDYKQSTTKAIFQGKLKAEDVNRSGYIPIHIRTAEDADLRIFYDGKPAKANEPGQSGSEEPGNRD
ncbi:MAG: Stk1 family PASTA domain-containing Ser/Thr kinase [Firmicutes bacterium]|nr:Stk1 family PASTA domain-containing Ser/Thr kinase [Bacillota bacterium]